MVERDQRVGIECLRQSHVKGPLNAEFNRYRRYTTATFSTITILIISVRCSRFTTATVIVTFDFVQKLVYFSDVFRISR